MPKDMCRNYHQSVLLVLVFLVDTSSHQSICEPTLDTTNNVQWPATSNRTLSSPICLDQNKEFIYRQCLNGQWTSIPNCSFTQPETLPQCPENFVDADNMCYIVTVESTFPPPCPFQDVLPFEVYKYVVIDQNLGPIWVPARRKGLTFMQWLEPSWSYQQEVTGYSFSKPVKNKECLIFHQQEFTLVSCNDKYKGVCAYQKLDQMTDNLCGSTFPCAQSDFNPKSKCFCRAPTWFHLGYSYAEFIKPYQYQVYKMISNESCSIALVKTSNRKYIWSNSEVEIAYSFWSPNATFDEGYALGAGTPEGWILTQNLSSCFIFEKEPDDIEPSLGLSFDDSNYRFVLTVVNPQQLKTYDSGILLYCFTNADDRQLILSYPSPRIIRDLRSSIIYAFEPWHNSSGDYWCEAFKKSDLQIIKTEKYFFRPSNNLEFVGLFQVRYENETNPLSQVMFNNVQNVLYSLVNLSSIQGVRVMQMIDLDEDQQLVYVNVHFTSTVQISSPFEESHYMSLKAYLRDTLREREDIVMLDFLSSDFCATEYGNLTWPKASMGSVVTPAEFCFKPDGSLVTRSCEGNFINGAQWSDFEGECEIFKDSWITTKLLRVFNNSGEQTQIDKICPISKYYHQFTALDVYLVAKAFSECLYVSEDDLDSFAETINSILKVDKSVLREAQLKLKATDKLLHAVDTVNFAPSTTFNFILENFVFMSLSSSDLSGVAVTKRRNKFVVTKLIRDYTFEKIMKIKNLESAIWVSSTFRKHVNKITLSMYFGDALFPQNKTVNTGAIFNIISDGYFHGPVYIIRRNRDYFHSHHKRNYCAFWGYDFEDRGSWIKKHYAEVHSDFLLCRIWDSANSAIVSFDKNDQDDPVDDSVTDDLINLLQSNDSVPETMQKLYQISEKYSHFRTADLSFVGQILEKVSSDEQVDFSNLANTVNNIQQIDRDVLSQSQVKGQATDTILVQVDTIIKNHNVEDTVQIQTDNFMIFIIDGKSNYSGVALMRHRDCLEPVFLDANFSFEDLIAKGRFDSAVVLSPDLQDQISADERIVITVYSNDALFNEETPNHTFVSKIFGVILPEIEVFGGPISVIYNREDITEEQCVYWYYDHQNNVSGSWRPDGDQLNTSDLVQCDFWHATHFAYLILDSKYQDESEDMFDFLELLTYINCIVSLVSLTCIVLTALFFRQWRDNTGNKILLHFTFVNIIQIGVFYISNAISEDYKGYIQCTIVGILLHYSIISQFCWMFVIAILQFRRFVIVLEGPPNFVLLKACVCGWGLPLLPVICVFVSDTKNYVNSQIGLCYPSGLGLYLGVWLPISIIILINFVLFSITLYNVIHRKTASAVGNTEALYQWRLAVLLFFILGFTWCFGFLAVLDFGLVFEYIFCMTATLQGFTLFLFFIVLNDNTRYLYVTAVGRFCKRKSR